MITLSDLVPGAFKAQSPATLRRGWHSPPDFTRRDETPRERARSHSPGSARLDSNPAHSGAEQCPREGMRERSGGPQKVPETAPGALARKVHSIVMGKPRQAGVENLDNGGPCRVCGAEERPSQGHR